MRSSLRKKYLISLTLVFYSKFERKFDTKSYQSIFLGYFTTYKLYLVYNKRTLIIKESIYVIFYESKPFDAKNTKETFVDIDFHKLNMDRA